MMHVKFGGGGIIAWFAPLVAGQNLTSYIEFF